LHDQETRQRSIGAAVVALFVAALVTACTNTATGPEAAVSQAADSPAPAKAPGLPSAGGPVAQPPAEPHYIVVEQGQSLNRIAHAHHVAPGALAAANQLQPPYKLKVGLRLVLPSSGRPPLQQANASSVPTSPPPSPTPPSSPPKSESTAAMAPLVPVSAAPLDGPAQESAAAPPPQMQAQATPISSHAPSVLPPRNPAAALPLPGEPAAWPSGGPVVNKSGESPTN